MIEIIILSAGQSSRMGSDKALLDIGGIPAIVHILNKIIKQSQNIYIVLGDNFDEVKQKVLIYFGESNVIKFIHNEQHEKGMFSSVKKGFSSTSGKNAVLLQLIDQPFIAESIYTKLISNYDPAYLIMQPSYVEGDIKRGGHPLIFAPEFKDIVFSYPIDSQLNKVIEDNSKSRKFIELNDRSILHNLNKKKDFNDQLKG